MKFDHFIHFEFFCFLDQCHKKLLFVTRLNKYEVDHDPDFCSVDDITDDFGLPSRRRLPQILSSHGFETHESHLRSKFFFKNSFVILYLFPFQSGDYEKDIPKKNPWFVYKKHQKSLIF